jgi:energy-coupling factor transporter ATP-binding protein EcfA2
MKKIELKYFKAFKTQLIIEFSKQQKHLLLYGENGAGKSSIYEALKVVFFRAKLEKSIPVALTPEDQAQENSSFWSKYDNRNAHQKFEIKINGEYHTDFKVADYQVFMISPSEFFFDDSIKYDTLLRQVYFDIDIELELELENFCSDNYQAIQDAVNKSLKDFHETVEIVIDNEDDFTVKIVDRTRNIESKTEIKKYFNEAKLNLIMLLLLLTTIKRAEKQDKTQILVS